MILRGAGRRVRRAISVGVLAIGAVILTPVILLAHAHLTRCEPAADATVATAPTVLRLWFSEAPDVSVSHLTLTDSAGAPIPLGALTHAPDDHALLLASIGQPLRDGKYTVNWHVVAADGHASSGTYSFVVKAAAAAAPAAAPVVTTGVADSATGTQEQQASSVAQIVMRIVELAALLAIIGGLVFGVLIVPAAHAVPGEVRLAVVARASRIVLGVDVLLLLSAAVRLWLEAQAMTQMGRARVSIATLLTDTTWGRGWIIQVIAALVLLAVVAWWRARGFRTLVAIAAIVLAATPGLTGHAIATPVMTGVAVGADTIHVFSAAGWLGSLCFVAVVGIPACLRAGGDARWASVASLVQRFSPMALTFGLLTVFTGVINARFLVGGPHELVTTTYGHTLIVKLLLVLVAICTGAYNWRRVRPALGTEGATARLQKSVKLELTAAALIVIVTAVLMGIPTPR